MLALDLIPSHIVMVSHDTPCDASPVLTIRDNDVNMT